MTAFVWESSTADRVTHARSRPWLAFGSAVTLEVVFVLALLAWMAARPAQVQDKPVPITIEVAAKAMIDEPPKPPERVQAKPLHQLPKPVTRAAVTPMPPMPPTPVTQAATLPVPLPVTPAPSPMQAAAMPTNPPVQAPAPAPAPPLQPTIDPTPAYNAKITAAAQMALEVPGSVTALNFKGRARVGFKLRDGVVSGIVLLVSSGLGAMDRAAAKAVQTANYPAPPVALQGKEIAYEIWVAHAPAN